VSVSTDTPLLSAQNVQKLYPIAPALPWGKTKDFVRAVEGVSFEIRENETLSVVGESGCGKTTTAKLVLRLEEPTRGQIVFRGKDIYDLSNEELASYRKSVQAVFQNPYSSLNPRMRIAELIAEPWRVNGQTDKKKIKVEVERLLVAVGLDPKVAGSFPHELSGGMRQRVAVARALILRPQLIVLDEPVSALDVSIRAQIMNLLKELQEEFGVAYLLIAHDLATTRYLSNRILVMYLGEVVELAESNELFIRPLHPYSHALISAGLPTRRWEGNEETILSGELPSPIHPPSGCRFHTRCPRVFDRCRKERPNLREISPGHYAACHLY
jgi:oligopeptide/dipeptide ABC transporter ATP-binding protein